MAKDPAVLFYTSDFLTGTILLSNEQKGMYITLLCLQHQKGLLSEKDMLSVCKTYDEDVFNKFIKTEDGYYNERMKIEHEKRSNFCKSRRDSVLKGIANKGTKHKKSVRLTYAKRMEDENVNKNINNNNGVNEKKEKEIKKKIPFSQSHIFDKVKFKDEFKEWSNTKLNYYYNSALAWSEEGGKKINWVTTIKNWELRDRLEGKEIAQDKNTMPKQPRID